MTLLVHGKNTPCYKCIFPHTHSSWVPSAVGSTQLVSGRKYTSVTGYTSFCSWAKRLSWSKSYLDGYELKTGTGLNLFDINCFEPKAQYD